MLNFIIGCVIGSCFGFTILALIKAEKYKNAVDNLENIDKLYFKCKINPTNACGDTCCKFCFGASDCAWACEGSPDICGQSYSINNKERDEHK